MRLKRLAKLGGGNTTPQAAPTPKPDRVEQPVQATSPVALAQSKVSLGKRPISNTPPPSQAPQPIRPAPATARLVMPYDQWEAKKVGEVFGVTLSVSLAPWLS